MTNAGADITVKIYVAKDTYISMSSKTYYSYKNTITILDEDGKCTPSRFIPLNDSECWLLVPDKLVPRVVTPTVVERKKGEKRNESNNRSSKTQNTAHNSRS